jgi:predicted PurR-regulated permease PerM
MEFFLPGLVALIIAALIVFLVLPRLGAPVLAVLAIVLLIYGVSNHMAIFYHEYRYSTWQEFLKFYAPFIMIAGLILAILFFMGYLFGTRGPSALPASNLPANAPVVNSAINTVSNVVNNTVEAVNNTVNAAANAVGFGNQNKGKNNSSVLTNLGRILNTPPMNRR